MLALCFGLPLVGSVQAVFAGFPVAHVGDMSGLVLVVIELAQFALAAWFLHARGWRLAEFNLAPSWRLTLVGILLCVGGIMLHLMLFHLLGRHLAGADLLLEIAKAITLSVPVAVLLSVVNGMFEELFLTGYVIRVLSDAGGGVALGASALVRLVSHAYQGPIGAVSVLGFGVIVTLYYWRYRRLWPVVVAHVATDLLALV